MKSSQHRYSRLLTLGLLASALPLAACDGKSGSASKGLDRPSPGQPNQPDNSTPGTTSGGETSQELPTGGETSAPDTTNVPTSDGVTSNTSAPTTSNEPTSSSSTNSSETATQTGTGTLEPKPATWKGDNFETNRGAWELDEKGVWGMGLSTSPTGPRAHGGDNVIGTVLAGDYPGGRNTAVLKSPHFMIPDGESARIRYWQWYNLGERDSGRVEMRVDGVLPGEEPADFELDGRARFQHSILGNSGGRWVQVIVELPKIYAGRRAQLVFKLQGRSDERKAGWFMDDFRIETGAMNRANEGFEKGWQDWSVQGSLWDIGRPADGLRPEAKTGVALAGTNLRGDYPKEVAVESRLLSPRVLIPENVSEAKMSYEQWFSFGRRDGGRLQVRVNYGAWRNVPSSRVSGSRGDRWRKRTVNIMSFADAGDSVQFGFLADIEDNSASAPGWYIDDVEFDIK